MRGREREGEKGGRETHPSCLWRMRERERRSATFVCVDEYRCCVSSLPDLSLSLSLSVSKESIFCRMATRHCIIMHDEAADARARQRHQSPSHMHRAGYRHAASASVYILSLMSMSQHKCTIQILITCLPRHAQGCGYKSYEYMPVGVCVHIHAYTRKYTNTLSHTQYTL